MSRNPVFDSDPLPSAQGSGGPILKSLSADPQGVVTAIVAYNVKQRAKFGRCLTPTRTCQRFRG